jgi:hypothetical protein
MDLYALPLGFAMALAQNTAAYQRFGQMNDAQRQIYIDRAKHARSEGEMEQIVAGIAAT